MAGNSNSLVGRVNYNISMDHKISLDSNILGKNELEFL